MAEKLAFLTLSITMFLYNSHPLPMQFYPDNSWLLLLRKTSNQLSVTDDTSTLHNLSSLKNDVKNQSTGLSNSRYILMACNSCINVISVIGVALCYKIPEATMFCKDECCVIFARDNYRSDRKWKIGPES